MKRYDMKAADAAALNAALVAAEIVGTDGLVAQGVILDVIGSIPSATGAVDNEGQPEFKLLDGYHANLYGDLTAEQEAALPLIPTPQNPFRKLAGE